MLRSRLGTHPCLLAVLVLASIASLMTPRIDARPRVLEESAKVPIPGAEDLSVIDVGLSGDTLLFAARRNFGDWSEQFGYLYQQTTDGSWVYITTLASTSAPNQRTPQMEVAVSGSLAAINTDQLYIFERLSTGWTHVATLPSGPSIDMEIDSGTILLGYSRCAWQAFRKGAGGWASVFSVGSILACNFLGFGQDVDIAGTTIVVANSAVSLPSLPEWPSRIQIFQGLTDADPDFVTDPSPQPHYHFGVSVAAQGRTVYATRPGAILAIEQAANGEWKLQAALDSPDSEREGPGMSLEAHDDFVVLGRSDDQTRRHGAGAVRVFERSSPTSYDEVAILLASGTSPNTLIGNDVVIDGRSIAASGTDAVYIFELPHTLGAPALLQDDFQDGNASGWSPSIASWNVATVGSKRVYRQTHLTGSNLHSVWRSVLYANQSVEADVKPTQFAGPDRWFGIITRYTDAQNYYYLSVRNTNQVLLRRLRRNTWQTLDSARVQVRANQTYKLRIEAIGTLLRGYVDGELLVEATDASMRTGRPGLITFGARADFDNVVVTPSPLMTLFADNFDGQFINENWRVASGSWEHVFEDTTSNVDIGKFVQTSSMGNGQVFAGTATDDQIVEADASAGTMVSGSSFGVMARYVDSRNFYYLSIEPQSRIALRRFVNGAAFELARAQLPRAAGVPNRLRLEALGPALRAYVDGKLILEVRDRTHTKGQYGLATFRTAAEFHNFDVTRP